MMLSSVGVGLTESSFIMERPLTATGRGVRSHAARSMIIARFLFLLILPLLSMCAPQVQTISREDVLTPELANPFGSGEDNRRLLQSYIKNNLKGQTSPELNTREQEVFFLFSLYDYDRSGQMDGLELMQLLTDFLSYHAIMPKSTDFVVSLVDYLLQTQDLNQDGLLAPSELLSPPTLDHQQENNIVPPEVRDETIEETINKEQTDTKSKTGDAETHLQEAKVQNNQEPEQLVEHENETEPAQHQQVEEPQDLNQIQETLEQQKGLQLPEEKLQDDHQGTEEHQSP